jgi:bifunctional DNA-binding transcriptional regulator/antitoxin component of YhaV-PrlF toxin-antitoxin module
LVPTSVVWRGTEGGDGVVRSMRSYPRYALPMAKKVKKARRAHQPRGRRDQTRISSKHQVTIPAGAFRSAGFQPGDTVRAEASGSGRVTLTRVDELLDRYSGCLGTGGELRRQVEELRGEWP